MTKRKAGQVQRTGSGVSGARSPALAVSSLRHKRRSRRAKLKNAMRVLRPKPSRLKSSRASGSSMWVAMRMPSVAAATAARAVKRRAKVREASAPKRTMRQWGASGAKAARAREAVSEKKMNPTRTPSTISAKRPVTISSPNSTAMRTRRPIAGRSPRAKPSAAAASTRRA